MIKWIRSLSSTNKIAFAAAITPILIYLISNIKITDIKYGNKPSIEIVNIYYNKNWKDKYPILDVKIKNISNSSLILYKLSFKLEKIEKYPSRAYFPVSYKYDLDVSSFKRKGQTKDVMISHEIKSGGFDRFGIVIGSKDSGSEMKKMIFSISFHSNKGVFESEEKIKIYFP